MMEVLVVDDDALVARSVRRKLQHRFDGRGVTVEVRTDLTSGLARVSNNGGLIGAVFDLRFGDATLGGLKLVDAARALDPDVPIALFTGLSPDEIADEVGGKLVYCVHKGSPGALEALTGFADRVLRRMKPRLFEDDVNAVARERDLTECEARYLRVYAEGAPDKQSAVRLGVPIGTLYNYKTRIIRKLETDSMRKALYQVFRRAYRDL